MLNKIKQKIIDDYSDYKQTLKKVSDEMYSEENIKFYNLDQGIFKRINKIEGKISRELTSADCIDFQNNYIYLIEFKNGKIEKKEERFQIRLKLFESLIGILKIVKELNYDINDIIKLNKKFILVYNEEKNVVNPNRWIEGKANIEILQKQLQEYASVIYDEVYVLSREEFKTIYLEKYYGTKN